MKTAEEILIEDFLQEAVNDYQMPYEYVKSVYEKYGRSVDFYDFLEEKIANKK